MAKEFGLLPSQVRTQATSYDIMVLDVMVTWEKDIQERAQGRIEAPNLSQDELIKIMKEAKGE